MAFVVVALGIWVLLHIYVGWRIAGLPWVKARTTAHPIMIGLTLLGLSYPAARLIMAHSNQGFATLFEFAGAIWIGVAFLLFTALLATDLVTLGGYLFPRQAPRLRTGAFVLALVLAIVALFQGMRPPVVREIEVALPGLPTERDGLRLVVVSDLHLGALIGPRWLADRVAQIEDLHPDAVLIPGDLVDSDLDGSRAMATVLARLQAPFGTWLVLGNHDVYAGAEQTTRFAEAAGLHVLRNRAEELAPGLRLAGLDDPAVQRVEGRPRPTLATILAGGRPAGATLLLAHTPDTATVREAAAAGVELMLSGHTHGGQLWPFGEIVRRRFPYFCGRYEVGPMALLVSRGAGTWGPRMRLWRPGEILLVRLRAPAR